MCRILPAIDSLDQHLYHLAHHPEAFRPQQCPQRGSIDSSIEARSSRLTATVLSFGHDGY